jgi:hypothetical protein
MASVSVRSWPLQIPTYAWHSRKSPSLALCRIHEGREEDDNSICRVHKLLKVKVATCELGISLRVKREDYIQMPDPDFVLCQC